MVTLIASLVLVFCVIGEIRHFFRTKIIGWLAFERQRHGLWTVVTVGAARVLSIACVCAGLSTMEQQLGGRSHKTGSERSLVIVVDQSISMFLSDAGPAGKLTRRDRAYDLVRRLLQDWQSTTCRVSFVAFTDSSHLIVADTWDQNIIHHLIDEPVPLERLFSGNASTDLAAGITKAFEVAAGSRRESVVVLISDGDDLHPGGLPQTPANVARCCIIGVGSQQGVFMPGSKDISHQEFCELQRLKAHLLRADYVDANVEDPASSFWSLPPSGGKPAEATSHSTGVWLLATGVLGLTLLPWLCRTAIDSRLPPPALEYHTTSSP